MKTWFRIKAKADNAVEVSIFDEIGAWGVTAKDFISELKAHSGKAIMLSINSPGGSVFDALAIYNALRGHGAKVTAKVMGVAASAASIIFMAGDKRVMPENTFLMVHNPLTFAYGNADELRDMADVLDKIAASLIGTYVSRSGKSEEDVKSMLDAETWLTATEAVDAGFATETEAAMKVAASFEIDRLPEKIRAVFDAGNSAGDIKNISPSLSVGDKVSVINPHDPAHSSGEIVIVSSEPVYGIQIDGMEDMGVHRWCVESELALASDGTGEDGDPADMKRKMKMSNGETVTDQINKLIMAAGFEDLASIWLLDDNIKSINDASAALAQAKEIRALCAAAKLPDEAAKLIRNRADMPAARKHLTDILAAADEETHTGSHQPSKNGKPAKNDAKPAALKTADVWASRRAKSH